MSAARRPRARRSLAKAGLHGWMALIEAGTRRWVPGNLKEASRAFDRLLTPAQQLAVVREVVETRAVELALAYRNVIDVSFGYRRRRTGRPGRYRIVRTPCVRFIVRDKWTSRGEERPGWKIPERLFAYCWVDGERRLCAVPTDVEDARAYAGIRAQGTTIRVRWQDTTARGALACALRRTGDTKTFALSCRHVLSLSDARHPEPTWGAAVEVTADGAALELGRTRAVAGLLREAPLRSFDAQLAEVASPDALRRALDGIALSGYATGLDELPDRFYIRTPRAVIPADKLGFVYDRPLYRIGQVGYVAHQMLVESVPRTATEGGDSGSPVVSRDDGGVLLGMHIAGVDNGDGNRFAYMIPAWQLFDPRNYDGAANSEEWSLLTL